MQRHAVYPIFCRDREDHSSLDVFRAHDEAEILIEPPEVESGICEAWDCAGFPLRLWIADGRARDGWLGVERTSDGTAVGMGFLLDVVREYARLNGVDVPNTQGESPVSFFERVQEVIETKRRDKRPWWRRWLRGADP